MHSIANSMVSVRNTLDILDSGQFSCGVFIDLKKAFDTVDYNILLEKLKNYEIRGVANSCFCSYFSGRKQIVSISGKMSEIMRILHGVPLGSVLGPLLFILYINDIHNCIIHSGTLTKQNKSNSIIQTASKCNPDME